MTTEHELVDPTPRVFFIQSPKPNLDVSGAADFGDIVTLMDNKVVPFLVHEFAPLTIRTLESYRYDPKKDYICLTGQMMAVSIAVAVAFQRYGTIRLLAFNAVSGDYEERSLSVDDLMTGAAHGEEERKAV